MKNAYHQESDAELLKYVLMIRHIYAHHSKLGGSGVLCDYLPGVEMRATDWPWGNALEGSRRWRVARRIFDCGILARARRWRLIHFIHAELHPSFTYRTLRRIAPQTKLLGTIHLPLDYYSLESSIRAFRNLHGIIALARWQVQQVKELLPEVQARWIPCGFDMEHPYRPKDINQDTDGTFRVVTIGYNYRDWPATMAIMEQAAKNHPEWRFHMVGLPAAKRDAYARIPNVVIEPRLDEAAYFALIARCHTLLLPLTFATNNTAVLEAYSVGTPTLCSDLPAIHDYAVSTTGVFRNPEEAIRILEERAGWTAEQRDNARSSTLREGKRFDWGKVADEVKDFYRELMGV